MVHVEPRRQGLDLRHRVLAIALGEPLLREVHDITERRPRSQRHTGWPVSWGRRCAGTSELAEVFVHTEP